MSRQNKTGDSIVQSTNSNIAPRVTCWCQMPIAVRKPGWSVGKQAISKKPKSQQHQTDGKPASEFPPPMPAQPTGQHGQAEGEQDERERLQPACRTPNQLTNRLPYPIVIRLEQSADRSQDSKQGWTHHSGQRCCSDPKQWRCATRAVHGFKHIIAERTHRFLPFSLPNWNNTKHDPWH